MGLTRRDFITLSLGAAAAVPLTPIPWKLLDDTAKWSQNWSWIPRPPRGEPSVRYSSCTLCPAGCGIRARCIGRNVIGIAPVKAHPVSQGVLCPYAFGAHQLPYHAARITRPLRNENPASLDTIAAEISGRVKTGQMAILDERPGRAVSAEYRRIAAARGGLYIVADRRETSTLQQIARRTNRNVADLGLALENVRTLVSFGAPVLESWATPGRVLTLWKQGQLAIVQVEAELSRTAALASRWLPVRAGSEHVVASLLSGNTTLPEASEATGVPADKLADTLRFIQDRGSMLALSGGGLPESVEETIAGLNAGSTAVVARAASPAAEDLSNVPHGSLDVLFIDHGFLGGSIPYDFLRSTLRPDGIIVSLSPYRAGVSALANVVIPTPAFGESLDEAPTPWDAVSPSYALAPALLDPPPGVTTALAFISRVTGGEVAPEAAIRARVEGLFTARRGEIFTFSDRATVPVTRFKSPADLYKAFNAGACWLDPSSSPCGVGLWPASRAADHRFSWSARPGSGFAPIRGTAITPPLWRS